MTDYIHRFVPGQGQPLLLLHGTGGDENDLVPLGQMIAPGSPLLSPRGNVLEQGMPRFFRRFAEGVFDEDDVRRRANELADFVGAACERHALDAPIAVGFSNGANIAAAMLLLRPEALAGAILLRAMTPLSAPPAPRLPGTPVLIVSGDRDPIAPARDAARLARILSAEGADVDHQTVPEGHMLSRVDIHLAQDFMARWATRANAAAPEGRKAAARR